MELFDINRKHSINKEYLKQIDTREKAYWLGFLWADGSIMKTAKRCSGNNRLVITQKESEINHLELFAKHINANNQIKIYKQCATLRINCRPLCMDLESLGFDKKESRVNIPKINDELIVDFIRGYFDGDGCLSLYVQKIRQYDINKQELSFTGKEILLKQIHNELKKRLPNISDTKLKTYKRTDKSVTLRYGKLSDVINICDLLYKNTNLYLNSKHNKYEMLIQRTIGRVPDTL